MIAMQNEREGANKMPKNFKCENCGRNMGDIDEPICHECEQREIDALAAQGFDRWGQPLEAA